MSTVVSPGGSSGRQGSPPTTGAWAGDGRRRSYVHGKDAPGPRSPRRWRRPASIPWPRSRRYRESERPRPSRRHPARQQNSPLETSYSQPAARAIDRAVPGVNSRWRGTTTIISGRASLTKRSCRPPPIFRQPSCSRRQTILRVFVSTLAITRATHVHHSAHYQPLRRIPYPEGVDLSRRAVSLRPAAKTRQPRWPYRRGRRMCAFGPLPTPARPRLRHRTFDPHHGRGRRRQAVRQAVRVAAG